MAFFKRIEYLDLEIKDTNKNIITFEKHKHNCYFDKDYRHILHSKDHGQYNSLVDIFISLAESLENQRHTDNKLTYSILEQLKDKNKMLKRIENNQDYIKQQNNIILEKLKSEKLPQNNQRP